MARKQSSRELVRSVYPKAHRLNMPDGTFEVWTGGSSADRMLAKSNFPNGVWRDAADLLRAEARAHVV